MGLVCDKDCYAQTTPIVPSIRIVVAAAIGIGGAVVAWPVVAWPVGPVGGGSSRSTQDAKANCGPRIAVIAATAIVAIADVSHPRRRAACFKIAMLDEIGAAPEGGTEPSITAPTTATATARFVVCLFIAVSSRFWTPQAANFLACRWPAWWLPLS